MAVKPVARRYADWAIPATIVIVVVIAAVVSGRKEGQNYFVLTKFLVKTTFITKYSTIRHQ
jgi:hypothetical protein